MQLLGVVPYTILSELYSVDAIHYVNSLASPVVCLNQPAGELPEQRAGNGSAAVAVGGIGHGRIP